MDFQLLRGPIANRPRRSRITFTALAKDFVLFLAA